jgi:hypothetical protein
VGSQKIWSLIIVEFERKVRVDLSLFDLRLSRIQVQKINYAVFLSGAAGSPDPELESVKALFVSEEGYFKEVSVHPDRDAMGCLRLQIPSSSSTSSDAVYSLVRDSVKAFIEHSKSTRPGR